MAEGNWQNPTGNTVTINTNNSTYIESGSLTYTIIGRIVVFSAAYTMKSNITESLSGVFSNLPPTLYASRWLIQDMSLDIDNTFERSAKIYGTYVQIRGPHTAGKTYTFSGAYITG